MDGGKTLPSVLGNDKENGMSWKIDTNHSQIEFSIKHMMITTVRGHFGSYKGTLEIDEQQPDRSFAEGTIEVASIDTGAADRDKHLRSADFFDVENYPTIHFRSTRMEMTGKDRFKLFGDLTIKDATQEIVFDARDEGQMKDPWGNQRRAFSAQAKLNRKDFGLNWNVALETGGWLVGDEVKILVDLQLVQEQPESREKATQAA
jgi:polyisoprenoid-binding protein YceI